MSICLSLLIRKMMTSTTDFWCLDNLADFYWQTKSKVSSLMSGGIMTVSLLPTLSGGGQSEIKDESHKSEPTATEIFIAGGLAGK